MPTQHTPTQLKQLLAKMLPELIHAAKGPVVGSIDLYWFNNEVEYKGPENEEPMRQVLDTELLELCRIVEEKLTIKQRIDYMHILDFEVYNTEDQTPLINQWRLITATPSQRIPCLAKVMGVEL